MADPVPTAPSPLPGPPGGDGVSNPPMLPKSPVGGPAGPGASPMLSPGAGAGNRAMAIENVKKAFDSLLIASMAFERGSREQTALLRAANALNPVIGKTKGPDMVPEGLAQMAMSKAGPPSAAPPPGMIPPNPSSPPSIGLPPSEAA